MIRFSKQKVKTPPCNESGVLYIFFVHTSVNGLPQLRIIARLIVASLDNVSDYYVIIWCNQPSTSMCFFLCRLPSSSNSSSSELPDLEIPHHNKQFTDSDKTIVPESPHPSDDVTAASNDEEGVGDDVNDRKHIFKRQGSVSDVVQQYVCFASVLEDCVKVRLSSFLVFF